MDTIDFSQEEEAAEDIDDSHTAVNGACFRFAPPYRQADYLLLHLDGDYTRERVEKAMKLCDRAPKSYQEVTLELLKRQPDLFLINHFLRYTRQAKEERDWESVIFFGEIVVNHQENTNPALGYLILAHAFEMIGDLKRAIRACRKGLAFPCRSDIETALQKRLGSVSRAQEGKNKLNGSKPLANTIHGLLQ